MTAPVDPQIAALLASQDDALRDITETLADPRLGGSLRAELEAMTAEMRATISETLVLAKLDPRLAAPAGRA